MTERLRETPLGLVEMPDGLERERRLAITAIQSCPQHKTSGCRCWEPSRKRLLAARRLYGQDPEAWLIEEVLTELDWLARAPRRLRQLNR